MSIHGLTLTPFGKMPLSRETYFSSHLYNLTGLSVLLQGTGLAACPPSSAFCVLTTELPLPTPTKHNLSLLIQQVFLVYLIIVYLILAGFYNNVIWWCSYYIGWSHPKLVIRKLLKLTLIWAMKSLFFFDEKYTKYFLLNLINHIISV